MPTKSAALSSKTTRVFKIVNAADWAEATRRGVYEGSLDDRRDGFIHLSAAQQLRGTLEKFFNRQTNLLLIAFEAADLGASLKWELSRNGEPFPHLYAPLPVAHALWHRPLAVNTDGQPTIDPDILC